MKLAAPLTAITAAVVGVILNLALFFAWRVFWPLATAVPAFLVALVAAAVLARFARTAPGS